MSSNRSRLTICRFTGQVAPSFDIARSEVTCGPLIRDDGLTYCALLQVCCDKVDLPGYELPEDATPFRMVPLKCCVESEKTVPGDLVAPCTDCGIYSILPDRDQCPCFSEAVLQEPVQWLKRQETLEGKKHDQIEDRLRPYQGTLGELVDEVIAEYKGYLFHRYLVRFIRRQFHLDTAFFDGDTEVSVSHVLAPLPPSSPHQRGTGCGVVRLCQLHEYGRLCRLQDDM